MQRCVIILCIFFTSCVGLKKYKEKALELDDLNAKQKQIRKEITTIKKQNNGLKTELDKLRNVKAEAAIKAEKSLQINNIKIKIDPTNYAGISVRNQQIDDEYYDYLKKNFNFKDTNSAKKTAFFTNDEKKLVYFLNQARLNPTYFCNKYIVPLLENDSSNIYVITLIDYMLTMKPVPALIPDKQLFESAECHVSTTGKLGKVTHSREPGCKSYFSGECCSYGLGNPLQIVIQLLVDQGVTSLGHRYICLGTYDKIGVKIGTHSGYGIMATLDFR